MTLCRHRKPCFKIHKESQGVRNSPNNLEKGKKMENSYFALKTHYSCSKQNCEVFISKDISKAIEYNRESDESLNTWSSYFGKVPNTIKCRNISQLKELYLRNCVSICK